MCSFTIWGILKIQFKNFMRFWKKLWGFPDRFQNRNFPEHSTYALSITRIVNKNWSLRMCSLHSWHVTKKSLLYHWLKQEIKIIELFPDFFWILINPTFSSPSQLNSFYPSPSHFLYQNVAPIYKLANLGRKDFKMFKLWAEEYSEHCQTSKKIKQRLKAVNYFNKILYLRCLTWFWIRLW